MKKISSKQLDTFVADLGKNHGNVIDYLLKLFTEEQPVLLDFLGDADDALSDDERDILLAASLIGWYAVREHGGCPAVDEDHLRERFDENLKLFDEKIIGAVADAREPLPKVMAYFNGQGVLMVFLVSLIVEPPSWYEGHIREAVLLPLILHVKTVIDCLTVAPVRRHRPAAEDGVYRQEDFDAMRSIVDDLVREHEKSDSYKKLKAEERKESKFVITAFGEMMYNYHLQMPADWRLDAALDCCVNIMPRKVMADSAFFEAIEPVLSSFLRVAAMAGAVPQGARIADGLAGVTARILSRAGDKDSWGFGKSSLNEAREKGVDIGNAAELDRFFLGKNEKKGGKVVPITAARNKIGRNEPCRCGSGKKYKHCCLRLDEAATVANDDSGDDLPIDDFLGLSPNQMERLINRSDFNDDDIVTFSGNIEASLLTAVPAVAQCRFLLDELAGSTTGLPATAKGNFKPELAKRFHDLFVDDPIRVNFPPHGHDDVRELEFLKTFMIDEGLMVREKGRYRITAKGRECRVSDPLALYRALFQFLGGTYSWLSGTRYHEAMDFIQTSRFFCLYLLAKKANEYAIADDLAAAYLTAFPSLSEETDDPDGLFVKSGFCFLFLEKYARYLGLVEIKGAARIEDYLNKDVMYRTTKLFRELFTWKL